jgi:hypothetical protein
MNFNDFYNLELYEIDLSNLSLLREMDKEDLMNNTDPKRVERARKELRTRPPKVTVMDDGIERVEYNFKANPTVEFRNHWGYCDHKDDDIVELFCDCKDFFFRLYAPLVKAGIAKYKVPPKFVKRGNMLNGLPLAAPPPKSTGYGGILPHNKQWTKKTNPNGTLYVCKHLYALLSDYI